MSKVIAFVPARCGSKSIEFKNIRPICGRPLIWWNLDALQQCEQVDEVYLATDCDQIEQTAREFGFSKLRIYRRSPANAADHSSTESVMLEFLDAHPQPEDALFLLVQATSPLTRTADFTAGLEQFRSSGADSLLTCVRIKRFFWSPAGESLNYDYRSRPRRQDFDGQLMENGAFYISKVGAVRQSGNRLSGQIAVCELPDFMATELDEPHDWVVMEELIRKHRMSDRPRLKVRLFVSDVDGVMTDAGMYYSENGDELKKFNTHDGMAFNLMQKAWIKTAMVTSENTQMVERRARKLKVDYLYQGKWHGDKLDAVLDICKKEGFELSEVAYIGDDINCREVLTRVGVAACPANALPVIKNIPGIIRLDTRGGEGAVREFYETYLA